MIGNGILLEFPTGRRLPEISHRVDDSVADLVRSLSATRATAKASHPAIHPLPIRLDLLTGVGDDTIAGLTALAAQGIVTPASAARLALRHAARSADGRSCRAEMGIRHPRHSRIVMTLAGNVFREHAFCLSLGETWLGFASADRIAALFEVCPSDRGPVCLLVGCDAHRRTTIRFVAPVDWRRCLAARPGGRLRAVHHVLVLGGIPSTGEARSAVLAGLRNATGSWGTVATRDRRSSGSSASTTSTVSALLTLIEIAMPGLVEGPAACKESGS